jgi:hypothetical protein
MFSVYERAEVFPKNKKAKRAKRLVLLLPSRKSINIIVHTTVLEYTPNSVDSLTLVDVPAPLS